MSTDPRPARGGYGLPDRRRRCHSWGRHAPALSPSTVMRPGRSPDAEPRRPLPTAEHASTHAARSRAAGGPGSPPGRARRNPGQRPSPPLMVTALSSQSRAPPSTPRQRPVSTPVLASFCQRRKEKTGRRNAPRLKRAPGGRHGARPPPWGACLPTAPAEFFGTLRGRKKGFAQNKTQRRNDSHVSLHRCASRKTRPLPVDGVAHA